MPSSYECEYICDDKLQLSCRQAADGFRRQLHTTCKCHQQQRKHQPPSRRAHDYFASMMRVMQSRQQKRRNSICSYAHDAADYA